MYKKRKYKENEINVKSLEETIKKINEKIFGKLPPFIRAIIIIIFYIGSTISFILVGYETLGKIYNIYTNIPKFRNDISFYTTIDDSGDTIYNKSYVLHNKNSTNDNTTLTQTFSSIGVQYLIYIAYDDIIIDIIFLDDMYSESGYLYNQEKNCFSLKRKGVSEYDELKNNIQNKLYQQLKKSDIPTNNFIVEETSFLCVLLNDEKHNDPQTEYYLLEDNGVLTFLEDEEALSFQYGHEISTIEDIANRSFERIKKIREKNLLWG